MDNIQTQLFLMQDIPYRDFQSKLIPNVAKGRIIGVRTPELRKFAKKFAKSNEAENFMQKIPHTYYDENNLHAFLIEQIKDYDKAIDMLDRFLPYVDNWATCDMMSPKILGKNLPALSQKCKEWISSDSTYTVRFGMKCLMTYFLDNAFDKEYPELVANVRSDEYYIKMMIAWYFATALAKQYDVILPWIEEHKLEPWVHNKAIQKARESYRISDSQKEYLKTLKIQRSI